MTNYEGTWLNVETVSTEELARRLDSAGIDLDLWGSGGAKTLADLYQEISEGESEIVAVEGRIERRLSVVSVEVVYEDSEGGVYRLVEDRQEFRDGRVRRRSLEASLGEKLKVGEDPEGAVVRALGEELGISEVGAIYALGHREVAGVSDSYPGLDSIYSVYAYVATLRPDDFNPEGYVESQADKVNYYTWSRVSSSQRLDG